MKLKDKLAMDFSKRPEYNWMDDKERDIIRVAFKIGFHKAKQMALDAVSNSDYDPTGCIYYDIVNIGEKEV